MSVKGKQISGLPKSLSQREVKLKLCQANLPPILFLRKLATKIKKLHTSLTICPQGNYSSTLLSHVNCVFSKRLTRDQNMQQFVLHLPMIWKPPTSLLVVPPLQTEPVYILHILIDVPYFPIMYKTKLCPQHLGYMLSGPSEAV